jgi:hypothetical protein
MDFLELPAEIGVLFAKPPIFERAANDQLQFLYKILGFENVIERTHLQGLNGGFGASECGEQYELPSETRIAKLAQKIDAGHVRHLDVGDDDIKFPSLRLYEALFCA